MTSLYEVLKAQKMGAAIAPDYFTALWAGATGGEQWEVLEYTGAVPAEITANGEPLLDYLISGNMQQTGTPTPENPIQPQETGERTGNLFDKNGETLVGNGAVINITKTGIKTIVQTQGNNRYSTIKLDNGLLGKTITISANITQSASNKGQIRLYYTNNRYAASSIATITTAGQTGYITRTYTMPSSIPSGSDGIAIVLSADRDGDGEVGDYVIYADLMIAEGSTALPYEPYGYKLDISSGGENLFDISTATLGKYINSQGQEVNSTSSADISKLNHTDYISVISGEPYIYNYVDGVTVTNTIALCWFDAQKQIISRNTLDVRTNNYSLSATAPNNAKYCIINFTGYPVPVSCLTFNLGSTAKPYTPFNRTTTPIYLGEVPTTRQVRKLVLTGEEAFTKNNNSSTNYLYYCPRSTLVNSMVRPPAIVSHLPVLSIAPQTQIGVNTDNGYNVVYFNFGGDVMNAQPSGNTAAGLKEYLAAQYANGTPVTVWYVLATEQTGILNEPIRKIGDYADSISMEQAQVQIPTVSGANVVDVETTLKPSEIYLKYKGRSS